MKNFVWIAAVVFTLCAWCGKGQADTLLITYHSGKTQTVILDEGSSAIQSLQYLPLRTPSAAQKPAAAQPSQYTTDVPESEVKPAKSQEKPTKKGVRFKWAEPLTGQ